MYEFFKPILEDFNNPVLYAIPFFVLLMAIEAFINWRERAENYVFKDSVASISMGVGSVFFDIIAKSFAFLMFSHLFAWGGFFKEQLSWTFLGWILLFFLDDFTFYWHHRMSHEVRLFWAAHVNHHSSEAYNLSTALRQSWTEVFHKYFFFLWLPLLGFPPMMVFMQMSINLIYQFWIHTKYVRRFPAFIEFIFNTPSHHRVHHASNIEYLDRNHAGTLIIWDRLFGTFAQERDDEPVVYGITTNINTHNPLRIATYEYGALLKDIARAPTFAAKFGYIFYPPGWSHDGSSLTANQMRKKQKREI
jgi:sterol desaturase/sphingolipid hydroxylase (fatty acid hydroxylase superfamily)